MLGINDLVAWSHEHKLKLYCDVYRCTVVGVLSGDGILSSKRGQFAVHCGDTLVIPASEHYTMTNSGTERLVLQQAAD